jgi:hypothetical protein
MSDWPVPKGEWKLVRKDDYWVFRWMGHLLAVLRIMPYDTFMTGFWTTFRNVVGYRTTLTRSQAEVSHVAIHEAIHVWRWEKWGLLVYATAYIGPSITIMLPLLLLSVVLAASHVVSWLFVLACAIWLVGLLPLSAGLAYGRWFIEREAYLVQLFFATSRAKEIERIVESLWKNYAWTWPRKWMRRWFQNECDRRGWR